MRPRLLKMTAFGPYAGEQIIDFRRLEDANMFLIYGPTGGGKTTILDGICYALYGETNGLILNHDLLSYAINASKDPQFHLLPFYLILFPHLSYTMPFSYPVS